MSDGDVTEAPEEPARRCPYCGGPPSGISHSLSALGYAHDDQRHVCADCSKSYTAGVPRGAPDRYYYDDLVCGSCGRQGRVHRIEPRGSQDKGDVIKLHLKCPNRFPSPCPHCEVTIEPGADLVRWADRADVAGPFACPTCLAALDRDDLRGCYHFWTTRRLVGPHGYSLVGWPMTTGAVSGTGGRGYGHVDGAVRPGDQPDGGG